MYGQASSSRQLVSSRTTEFDVLKASHKFLREDDEPNESSASWEERLAQKYYASLYREFAMCDLKHYKSGNFALRWRTEEEVLSGAGEETCGNTRCPLHDPNASPKPSGLKTVELPFAYEEHGQRKSALVKVVLCDSCLKKLMYRREKERKRREKRMVEENQGDKSEAEQNGVTHDKTRHLSEAENSEERKHHRAKEGRVEQSRKRKKSRSRSFSPSHKQKREHKDKHRLHSHLSS